MLRDKVSFFSSIWLERTYSSTCVSRFFRVIPSLESKNQESRTTICPDVGTSRVYRSPARTMIVLGVFMSLWRCPDLGDSREDSRLPKDSFTFSMVLMDQFNRYSHKRYKRSTIQGIFIFSSRGFGVNPVSYERHPCSLWETLFKSSLKTKFIIPLNFRDFWNGGFGTF